MNMTSQGWHNVNLPSKILLNKKKFDTMKKRKEQLNRENEYQG